MYIITGSFLNAGLMIHTMKKICLSYLDLAKYLCVQSCIDAKDTMNDNCNKHHQHKNKKKVNLQIPTYQCTSYYCHS